MRSQILNRTEDTVTFLAVSSQLERGEHQSAVPQLLRSRSDVEVGPPATPPPANGIHPMTLSRSTGRAWWALLGFDQLKRAEAFERAVDEEDLHRDVRLDVGLAEEREDFTSG